MSEKIDEFKWENKSSDGLQVMRLMEDLQKRIGDLYLIGERRWQDYQLFREDIFISFVNQISLRVQDLEIKDINKNGTGTLKTGDTVFKCITDLSERIKISEENLGALINRFNQKLQDIDQEEIEKNIEDLNAYIESHSLRIALLEKLEVSNSTHLEPKLKGLNFGEALAWMKKGYKVSCWNTDNIYVGYQPEDGNQLGCLKVKTMAGQFGPWTPHHGEILAENWRVIND